MVAILERIERAGRRGTARRLFFSGSDYTRVTSAAAVKALDLRPGVEVDLQRLESHLDDLEPRLAREYSIALLRQRERSCTEIIDRLGDAGYPARIAQNAAEWLVSTQLLSDERFAFAWARSRQLAGYGRARIARELALKGVSKELSAAGIEEAFAGVHDVEEARRIIGHLPLSTPRERQRAIRRLVSRGFALDIAFAATGLSDDGEASSCRDD